MSIRKVKTPFGIIDIELDDGLVPEGYDIEWDDRPMSGAPSRWSPVVGYHDVPVRDGFALLPDGRTIATTAQSLRVPYVVRTRRKRR